MYGVGAFDACASAHYLAGKVGPLVCSRQPRGAETDARPRPSPFQLPQRPQRAGGGALLAPR